MKSYDYFLTGQCYGFQLFREDVEVDSCWGFLGEIRDVQDDVKDYLPEDCDPAIVELLQFRYEELDIDEYLEEGLENGRIRLTVHGNYNENAPEGTDFRALVDGYISVGKVNNLR